MLQLWLKVSLAIVCIFAIVSADALVTLFFILPLENFFLMIIPILVLAFISLLAFMAIMMFAFSELAQNIDE